MNASKKRVKNFAKTGLQNYGSETELGAAPREWWTIFSGLPNFTQNFRNVWHTGSLPQANKLNVCLCFHWSQARRFSILRFEIFTRYIPNIFIFTRSRHKAYSCKTWPSTNRRLKDSKFCKNLSKLNLSFFRKFA